MYAFLFSEIILINNEYFAAFFIRPFYKMMLTKPITLRDMESVVSNQMTKFFVVLYKSVDQWTYYIICLITVLNLSSNQLGF